MVNYQNGKIYAIKSNLGDKLYVGSTTKKYLSARLSEHRKDFKAWKNGGKGISSRELFIEYGIENCYIELIELFPCNTKDELKMRENHYIRSLVCVNKYLAIITQEDRKAYFADYYQEHKEKIKQYQVEYREENKEEILRKKAEYHIKNREELLRKAAEYYEKNSEEMKRKAREYVEKNKEKTKNYQAEYREENKEEILRKKAEYYEKNKEAIQRKDRERYAWKVISREFRAILNED
jgi:hypothetical protein